MNPLPKTLKCSKCKTEKDVKEFNKNNSDKRGYRYWCRSCTCEYNLRKKRAMRFMGNKMYDGTLKECYFCHKVWPRNEEHWNKCSSTKDHLRATCRHCSSDSNLHSLYGMTREDKVDLHQFQGGVCALCKKFITTNGDANVDHDHSVWTIDTGIRGLTTKQRRSAVNGLLCAKCNKALGLLYSTGIHPVAWATNVLAYESNPPAKQLFATSDLGQPPEPSLDSKSQNHTATSPYA